MDNETKMAIVTIARQLLRIADTLEAERRERKALEGTVEPGGLLSGFLKGEADAEVRKGGK